MINSNLKQCEICGRHFFRLDIHHKDGNHENNKKGNTILVCQSCHMAIHNIVSNRRDRKYQDTREEEYEETNERIYDLRVILHLSKFGHQDFIPNDNITKMAKIRKFVLGKL